MAQYIVNKGFSVEGKKAGEKIELTGKAADTLLKKKIVKKA